MMKHRLPSFKPTFISWKLAITVADVALSADDFKEAKYWYNRALAMRRGVSSSGDHDSPEVVVVHRKLGLAYQRRAGIGEWNWIRTISAKPLKRLYKAADCYVESLAMAQRLRSANVECGGWESLRRLVTLLDIMADDRAARLSDCQGAVSMIQRLRGLVYDDFSSDSESYRDEFCWHPFNFLLDNTEVIAWDVTRTYAGIALELLWLDFVEEAEEWLRHAIESYYRHGARDADAQVRVALLLERLAGVLRLGPRLGSHLRDEVSRTPGVCVGGIIKIVRLPAFV